MHKPVAINLSNFWDTSFDAGSGLLPTFAITTGSLGILAWLLFIVFLFTAGAKSFFRSHRRNLLKTEMVAFFIMSLYLFVVSFFYPVGSVMFLLAFIFLGAFIGLSTNGDNETKKEIVISFLNDPRKSFFSILALVLVMIISASACFKYVERFASVPYFQKTFSAQSVEDAESSINKAVSLYPNDLYLRTYAQVYLLKINSIVSKGSLSDSDKADLKTNLDQAVSGAQLAENYDQTNFLNSESLGSVYDTGASLGVTDAYSKAIDAYQKASTLNPLNPGIKLVLARIAFRNGDVEKAKGYAKEALSLKQDYVDALVTLSQIAKNGGNNTDALSYAQTALSFSPQDKSLIQYVNSLKNTNSAPIPTSPIISSPISNKQ